MSATAPLGTGRDLIQVGAGAGGAPRQYVNWTACVVAMFGWLIKQGGEGQKYIQHVPCGPYVLYVYDTLVRQDIFCKADEDR